MAMTDAPTDARTDALTAEPSPTARLSAAVLEIADAGDWESVGFRAVADAAGLDPGDAFFLAPGKAALVNLVSDLFDQAAFGADLEGIESPVDRLFEAVMARLEVMEPHRMALSALAAWEGAQSPAMLRRLSKTARAVLEASGVDTSGRRGLIRLAAFTPVLMRVLLVWRDDEGALNRTMAELDRRVKQMRRALALVAADF